MLCYAMLCYPDSYTHIDQMYMNNLPKCNIQYAGFLIFFAREKSSVLCFGSVNSHLYAWRKGFPALLYFQHSPSFYLATCWQCPQPTRDTGFPNGRLVTYKFRLIQFPLTSVAATFGIQIFIYG